MEWEYKKRGERARKEWKVNKKREGKLLKEI